MNSTQTPGLAVFGRVSKSRWIRTAFELPRKSRGGRDVGSRPNAWLTSPGDSEANREQLGGIRLPRESGPVEVWTLVVPFPFFRMAIQKPLNTFRKPATTPARYGIAPQPVMDQGFAQHRRIERLLHSETRQDVVGRVCRRLAEKSSRPSRKSF